jgi:DNA-binding LacI/PurR family transcriptional regulator
MKENRRNIYDIAAEAGVSIATVSRVMANHPHVSAGSRAKVMEVIKKNHYQPGYRFCQNQMEHQNALGVIVPAYMHSYFAQVLDEAEDEARQHGFSLFPQRIVSDALANTQMIGRMIASRLKGVIYVGGITESKRNALITDLIRLQAALPVVAISPPVSGLNCIYLCNDLADITAQAVRHLQMLGHKRFAYIGGGSQIRSSGERGRGFLEEIEALKLPQGDYQHEAGFNPEDGELAVLRLYSNTTPASRPTALLAFNDMVALGALRQLNRMGLRVPEDVAVIGCDNQFFSAYTHPPMTTLDLHISEHSRCAVKLLIGEMESPATPFTQVREPSLIIRESCGVKLGVRSIE